MATWLSPSYELADEWINEELSVDGITAHGATVSVADFLECPYLIFPIVGGAYVDKIKIWFESGDTENTYVTIDVFSGGWLNVVIGVVPPFGEWVEYPLSTPMIITSIRFKAYAYTNVEIELNEIQYQRIAPAIATTPDPDNNATGVAIDKTVGWVNGAGTSTVDVYFGTVTPPVTKVVNNQLVTSYDHPEDLANGTDYYWRVDTRNVEGTTTGNIWMFTTASADSPFKRTRGDNSPFGRTRNRL